MASYNRVVLMGNVTRDPQPRYLPSGMAVCDIGLAVNDRRKDASGNWVDETTFVDVTLWGRTAETAGQYTRKGSPVLIEGRLKLDTWETDGQKRSKLKVVGERLCLLGSRDSSGGGSQDGGYASRSQNQNMGGGKSDAGYSAPGQSYDAAPNQYDSGSTQYDASPAPMPPNDDIPF